MKYVYRIVNILLSLAVFPVFYFVQMIYIEMSLSFGKSAMYEVFSLKDIVDIINGKSDYSSVISLITKNSTGVFRWPDQFSVINTRLIVIAVCVAIMLIAALTALIVSIVSNKRIPVLVAGSVGLVATIVMIAVFKSVALEFTSGNIDVVSSIAGAGLITKIADFVVKISALRLAGVQNAEIILFSCLILWTVIFYLSELGETPAEQPKRRAK